MPSQNAKHVREGGGVVAPPAGREGAGGRRAFFPEHCGQRAGAGSGLERLQPGTRTRSQPTGDPTCKWGLLPTGDRWVKLEAPRGQRESGAELNLNTGS